MCTPEEKKQLAMQAEWPIQTAAAYFDVPLAEVRRLMDTKDRPTVDRFDLEKTLATEGLIDLDWLALGFGVPRDALEAAMRTPPTGLRLAAFQLDTYRDADDGRYLLPRKIAEANDGLCAVAWEDEALVLAGSTYDKAIQNVVRDRKWVILKWAPAHLSALLTKWFWKDDKPAVSVNKVWLDTCKYLYLPRLQSSTVFTATIESGVAHRDWFGYAATAKDGEYAGLLFGTPGTVYLTDQAVLIRPDAAAPKPEPVEDTPPASIRLPRRRPGRTRSARAPSRSARPRRLRHRRPCAGSTPRCPSTQRIPSARSPRSCRASSSISARNTAPK